MEILIRTLALGLAAGGFAVLFRALPWPAEWKKRKPLACSACMAGWSALFVMTLALYSWPGWRQAILLWLGATAVAAVVHRYLYPPEIEL